MKGQLLKEWAEQEIAKKRLHAAAPELLSVCQWVLGWHNSQTGHDSDPLGPGLLDDLESAIAKATVHEQANSPT